MGPEEIGRYVDLGAVGVLGAAFLVVMRWMLNQMSRQFRAIERAIEVQNMVILDLHHTMIRHDAKVRGVNPTVGENQEEACKAAAEDLKEVLATIASTRDTIQRMVQVPTA
jgi:hypothetical protein